MLETSCTTGIRVNEVKYITVEAAHSGLAEIALKWKIARSCFRPACVASCRNTPENKKIASGEISIAQSDMGMDRKQNWAYGSK